MNIGYAIIVAVCFVLWPIIGRYAASGPAWTMSIVMITTGFSAAIIALAKAEFASIPLPDIKQWSILLVAGVLNGVGVWLYTHKTSGDISVINVDTGVFVLMVSISMVFVAPILSWLINGEVLNIKQFAGIACAILAIYLLQ